MGLCSAMKDCVLKAKCDCAKHTGSLTGWLGLYQVTGKLSWSHNHGQIFGVIIEKSACNIFLITSETYAVYFHFQAFCSTGLKGLSLPSCVFFSLCCVFFFNVISWPKMLRFLRVLVQSYLSLEENDSSGFKQEASLVSLCLLISPK